MDTGSKLLDWAITFGVICILLTLVMICYMAYENYRAKLVKTRLEQLTESLGIDEREIESWMQRRDVDSEQAIWTLRSAVMNKLREG